MFPPHVHAAAWGTAVALCALMGLLAGPSRRGGALPVWLVAALAGALAINLTTAYQTLQAARTLATWAACLCAFLYCARLRRTEGEGDAARDPGPAILWAVAVSGAALAAHGLYQVLHGFDRLATEAGAASISEAMRARIASGRAVATFGLPDALAGLLAMSLPVSVHLSRSASGTWRRRMAVALGLVQAAGLLATRSAGGAAALAVAGALVSVRGGAAVPTRARKLALVCGVAGLVLAALMIGLRLRESAVAGQGDPLALRLGNWRVALAIAADHPLFGAGAGCYGIAFPAHRAWGMNESRFAHNSYLQLLSETGPLLAAAALIGALLLARRALQSDEPWIAIACLGFLVHNAADITLYLPSVALVFSCLAGLLVRAAGRAVAPARAAVLPRAVAALALALFALAVTRADMKRDRARSMALEGATAGAEALAQEAVAEDPLDPDGHALLSHLLLERAVRGGDAEALRQAEELARRATALDPRTPHHWSHLGTVLLARGDRLGAYVSLARAALLYPIKIEYREQRDALGAQLAAGPTLRPDATR